MKEGRAKKQIRQKTPESDSRKPAEPLKVSESRYRMLFESAQDGILILEAETGMIMDVNPFLVALLGYSHEELLGKKLWELGLFKDIAASKESFTKLQSQGYVRYENLPLETKGGSSINVEFVSNVFEVERQKVIRCTIRDITERKAIEAGLEKTRKELEVIKKSADEASEFAESVINTVREPLIALDQDLRVVKVSRSFYEFFKVKPEETVGQLIYDLGNKQWNIPKLRELLETILPQKTTFDNYEVEHDFATIGRRIMLLNARQIEQGMGKERVILLAIEDITARKEIEAGLEQANKEMEAFAYSVSHDLRTPLRGIDGWSQALLEDYKDKLDEQGQQYLNRVRSETQRMGKLIDDLLMFSRQTRSEMEWRQLDMTAMAQNIISRLQQQNPALQVDVAIQPGLTVQGDSRLLEIALVNLLDNAMKFSSKNAHGRIEFGQVEQEGRKAFFVRDNGVGFDMAYANKLFGVFQRLHSSSEFPGTGIGLATVQRIINRHGGRIWAEAQVNQGATFYFTLKEGA